MLALFADEGHDLAKAEELATARAPNASRSSAAFP
jgi:hypothetical protein